MSHVINVAIEFHVVPQKSSMPFTRKFVVEALVMDEVAVVEVAVIIGEVI